MKGAEFHTWTKFDPDQSKTISIIDANANDTEIIRGDDGNWNIVDFTGKVLRDNFFLTFYNEVNTTSTLDFFGITGDAAGSPKFTRDITDGTMGLAPFSSADSDKERNLLYQLKRAGNIDSMVFSIYMKMNNQSHVKIGGFDEIGAVNNVTGNKMFNFSRSTASDSWKLNLESIRAFGEDLDVDFTGSRSAILELAYPYLYMPKTDMAKLSTFLT